MKLTALHIPLQNIMAERSRNIPQNFDFSNHEVSNIQKALKDETFVKLLADYAKELSDPATKARYEAEIAEYEGERGYSVTFLHPKSGYVIKETVAKPLIQGVNEFKKAERWSKFEEKFIKMNAKGLFQHLMT